MKIIIIEGSLEKKYEFATRTAKNVCHGQEGRDCGELKENGIE